MKIILITGSTDGIGKEAARYFVQQGFQVIIHGRSPKKVDSVLQELRSSSPHARVSSVIADFSSFNDVVAMAQDIKRSFPYLDVLVNNAAAVKWNRTTTPDGNEYSFQVNHLSPVLLTLHLLPLLRQAPRESRIINVSSMIHAGSIDLTDLQSETHYSPYHVYSMTKLCNLFFTFLLANKLQHTNIKVNAIHPGVLNTKLLREFWGGGSGVPVSDTLHYVALSSEITGITGAYFENKRPTEPKAIAKNEAVSKQCWEKTITIINPYLPQQNIISY